MADAADFVEVAVDEDEVRVVAGDELAFVLLGKFGVGGALRVGVERLAAGELVLRKVGFGAGFVHARDGGVEAAKGRDGLDGIVGAEGERHAGVEECLPCVGVGGALGAETRFGPVHVGEQMVGLHGGDDAELLEARNVGGIDDLRVLDAVARGAGDAGLRIGVESHGGGLVADGVKAELEAGLGAFDGHLVQLGLGVLGQAGVAGIVGVGRFHGGGAGAERAIHEALQKAGVQHGIVGRSWWARILISSGSGSLKGSHSVMRSLSLPSFSSSS